MTDLHCRRPPAHRRSTSKSGQATSYRGHARRQRDPKTGRLARSLGPVRRLSPAPKDLTGNGVHFDNLALVPASLLPLKAKYQEAANRLPRGQVLIVLPRRGTISREATEKIATHLQRQGRRVTTIPTQQLIS